MALKALMPEPHSKMILWYRCDALSSALLGMAYRIYNHRWMTSEHHCEHWPRQLITIWATYGSLLFLTILQAPTCLIIPLEDALISDVKHFTEKRLLMPRSEWLEKKLQWLNGYFAYWTLMSFLSDDKITEGHGSSGSRNMTGQETTTPATSHASHQYEPRSRQMTNQA